MAKKKRTPKAPIGELFSDKQAAAPVASQQSLQGCLLPIVALLLVVVLVFMSWSKFVSPQPDDGDRKQDQHGQRDDQAVNKDGYLIFIHERSELSASDADTLDMAEAFCQSHPGLEIRSVDDDDPSDAVQKLVAFAASKSVNPPCVVFKTKDNTPRAAAKWPSSEAELKKVLSSK